MCGLRRPLPGAEAFGANAPEGETAAVAIYHASAKTISRSSGRSATGAAAYRSGEKIHDRTSGETFDYTRKQAVGHTEILAPANAPAWMLNREELWNAVERSERRKDAQLAREFEVAIPRELDADQQRELVHGFAQEQFVERGMVADICMHDTQGDNPHAHIMLTMREIDADGPEGFSAKKQREWNSRELLQEWREAWADHANQALEQAGRVERIDHRSLEAQGIDRVPQIHHGNQPIRIERNERIKQLNSEAAQLEREADELHSRAAWLDLPDYDADADQDAFQAQLEAQQQAALEAWQQEQLAAEAHHAAEQFAHQWLADERASLRRRRQDAGPDELQRAWERRGQELAAAASAPIPTRPETADSHPVNVARGQLAHERQRHQAALGALQGWRQRHPILGRAYTPGRLKAAVSETAASVEQAARAVRIQEQHRDGEQAALNRQFHERRERAQNAQKQAQEALEMHRRANPAVEREIAHRREQERQREIQRQQRQAQERATRNRGPSITR